MFELKNQLRNRLPEIAGIARLQLHQKTTLSERFKCDSRSPNRLSRCRKLPEPQNELRKSRLHSKENA